MCLLFQQLVDLLAFPLDQMLHVLLLCLVTRERHVEPSQHTILLVLLQLLLIQVVLSLVPTAKEKNSRAKFLL